MYKNYNFPLVKNEIRSTWKIRNVRLKSVA